MFLVADIIPLIIMIFLLVFIALAIIYYAFMRHQKKKMAEDVYELLVDYSKEKEILLSKTKLYEFDYILEDKTSKTYVKIIPNFQNYEILINSKTKWQIKKSANDDSNTMVEGIEIPMLKDVGDGSKEVKKLFIIYPSARMLMMAVNECEYEFIYPDTNVYDSTVLTYKELCYLVDSKNYDF